VVVAEVVVADIAGIAGAVVVDSPVVAEVAVDAAAEVELEHVVVVEHGVLGSAVCMVSVAVVGAEPVGHIEVRHVDYRG
jgi:hypothetical protein